MSSIAIIPARGGSKRIPKKNMKNFFGKPIIYYSIKAAQNSGIFDTVMVSTDDVEIATYAKSLGAEVPFYRSPKNSDDFATTADVILEVIDEYKKLNKEFEYCCCIYPTAPLIKHLNLQKAYEILLSNKHESVIPIVSFSYPIQRALKVSNAIVNFNQKEFALSRSQDLETFYHDAGQFYFFNTDSFLRNKKIINDNTGYIILKDTEVQDIDNLEDWKIAELKFNLL